MEVVVTEWKTGDMATCCWGCEQRCLCCGVFLQLFERSWCRLDLARSTAGLFKCGAYLLPLLLLVVVCDNGQE
jgi:hypothetical protein